MSSPSMVQRSGDTLLVRSVLSGDSLYEESEDEADLPQCKIKRNYTCTHCTYYTQNPRSYLYHLKDEHGEKIKVYECPNCLYASKHSQKLQRHVHMVHVIGRGAAAGFKKKKSEVTKTKLWNSTAPSAAKQIGKKPGGDSKTLNMSENISLKMSGADVQGCSLCPFTSSDPNEVLKHERTAHLKKKFYRCSKCNYVTHMKARYTKHVKYHSMPMIKCDLCDFRTPYKWNLDRHYKNHTGDGAYRCALCNFTADIKQSLTVHEMNHHVPPIGQPSSAGSGAGTNRRRNKVGASDSTAVEEEIDQEELELLRMEREDAADSAPRYQAQGIKQAGSGASTATFGNISNKSSATPGSNNFISSNGNIKKTNTITSPPGNTRRTPKIKVTLKKLKTPSSQEQNERHNFQTDFIHPDDIIHHKNGNVYIKNLKCRMCNYKAAWEGEMARHESKAHGIHRPIAVKQAAKKVSRPIPNLIPIQNKITSPGSVSSLPILRIPTVRGRAATSMLKPQQLQTSQQESGLSERDLNEICAKSCPNSSLKDFASLIGGEDAFKMPDDELNEEPQRKTSPKQEEDYYDEDEVAPSDSQSQSKPNTLSSVTDLSFKKKNASFFDKLKEKLLVSAGESCNLVCTCCGHESKCLSELARHQKLHSSPGNRSSDGGGTNGGSSIVLASGAELSSTRCQHCRQRCKTSADLLIHLQSCSEANKNLAGSSPSPAPMIEMSDAKEEKVKDVEDEEEEEEEEGEEGEEEEEKVREEEPHPMENKVFVWNNLPQPIETESEEDHQPQSQAQQQEEQELQQQKLAPPLQQQDDDSLDTSVRSKSPISEGSLVGIETAPGYGAVTSKIPSDSPDGPLPDMESKAALTVKKVFKCPNCSFWASTASRFHVHIVGHLNKKPFECSLCAYRSNWRWDITKHIRLKSARDVGHERARVLMTDETGRRNYSKYNKYLTLMRVHEPTAESSGSGRRSKGPDVSQGLAVHSNVSILQQQLPAPPRLTRAPTLISSNVLHLGPGAPLRPPPPLRAAHLVVFPGPPPLQPQPSALLQQQCQQQNQQHQLQQHQHQQQLNLDVKPKRALKRLAVKSGCITDGQRPSKRPSTDSKKTLWKCKKCNYRDASRELVLAHVKEHYQQRLQQASSNGGVGSSDSAERHCRLKHSGDVRVVIGLKEGGTVEERFMIDDGGGEVDSPSAPPGRPERSDLRSACDRCPFMSDTAAEMEAHKEQHSSRPGAIFKCYFCPFYVSLKRDLLQHMRLHGVTEPEDYISKAMQGKSTQKMVSVKAENRTEEPGGRQHHSIDTSPHKRYKCVGCPYVSNSKSQFLYHKQFHRPRGAPFKCGLCSYNVSRRHLLHQHLRVHGILVPPQKSPTKSSDKEMREDGSDEIEEVTVMSHRSIAIPLANDSVLDTRRMTDIPLVWVSRGRKFSKMFKCRFCPHVNLRKANIQEHEKMHRVRNASDVARLNTLKDKQSKEQGSSGNQHLQQQPLQQHHCPDCNYICNNAGVLSSHAKVHQGLYGQVHCLVDTTRSDEAQLQELSANMSKGFGDNSGASTENEEQGVCEEEAEDSQLETLSKENISENKVGVSDSGLSNNDSNADADNGRLLYFCSHCPARFLFEKELTIHVRFHEIRLAHRCESCSYTARQRPHLLAHLKVHTEEYQERTNVLSNMYKISPQHSRPRSAVIVEGPGVSGPVWVVIGGATSQQKQQPVEQEENNALPVTTARTVAKQYACKLCPARFFKFVALEYHTSLHGGSGPHRCRSCDYAVKTYGNLVKHEMIHDGTSKQQRNSSSGKNKSSSGTVPLSGTELFQQRAEAQKQSNTDTLVRRNFIDHSPLHADPQFGILMHGNPDFIYPTYLKNGRLKEKRYKCHKCPSAFEKREQYKVHLSLHGSKQRYRCEKCDYSVKYYANYIQHMRKHKNNEEALEARKLEKSAKEGSIVQEEGGGEKEGIEESNALEEDIPPLTPRSLKTIGSSPTGRHGPLQLSMADRQTILLLQQRRSSNASSSREGGDERKCFRCPHCPYSSQRRDGVESHIKRHLSVSGVRGSFICSHCDYTVPQLHFLREHKKLHFKKMQPDIYMKYDRIELWACEEGKENMDQSAEGFVSNSFESNGKKLVFQDNGNAHIADSRFYPALLSEVKGEEMDKLYIDLRTGEPVCEKSSSGDGQDMDEQECKELVVYNTGDVGEKFERENSDNDEVEATESINAEDSKSESGSSSSSSGSSSSSSSSNSSSSSSNSTSSSDSNSSNSSNSSSNNSSNSSSSSSSSSSSGDSDSDDNEDNTQEVKSADDCASTCSGN